MKDELLLSCECHGYHYVEFWADKDFGVMVTHVERPRHWREKLSCIWKVIRGEEIFDGDLIVRPRDYQPLIDWLKLSQQDTPRPLAKKKSSKIATNHPKRKANT